MTANTSAAHGDRPSVKLTGSEMSAALGSRARSAHDGTPRDTASTRRRRAVQRVAESAPESALLTVDQLCAELQISRSTFYDWRAKGKAPECIVLPNGSLRIQHADLAQWLRSRRAA
jgi:predicted DNA-binding transcriptional regulator AlpA